MSYLEVPKSEIFSGLCRCCLEDGYHESLLASADHGKVLEKCLCLKIFHRSEDDPLDAPVEPALYLICENCIEKLKYCVEFKAQILSAMEVFENMAKSTVTKEEKILIEDIVEKKLSETVHTWPSIPVCIKTHKNSKKRRKQAKIKDYNDIEAVIELTDNIKSETTEDAFMDDDHFLPDLDYFEERSVTVKRKYVKKKPSGAQRAREILSMMDLEKLQCKVCSQTFPNNYGLKVHMHDHFPDYKCEICGKGFAIKRQCQYHRRRHQTGEFVCGKCGQTLQSRGKYEHHMFTHRTKDSYVCRHCGGRFKSHYAREKHLRDAHESEKKYECQHCKEKFLIKSTLDVHCRRVHARRENNYICDLCNRGFFDRAALKKHMVVHNGERVHQCTVCLKSYPRLRTLNEHMKIHNNVRDHMCNVCGKAFVQACTLRVHLLVHDREKNQGNSF